MEFILINNHHIMCKSNVFCSILDGSCLCSQLSLISGSIPSIPIAIFPQYSHLFPILSILKDHNDLLESIRKSVVDLKSNLELFSHHPPGIVSPKSPSENGISSALELEKYLWKGNQQSYTLQSVAGVVNPAYKGRSFSLLLQIVDQQGNPAKLEESIVLQVFIFSTENPLKKIDHNTAGEGMLKGTTMLHGNSTFFFRKIAVKEVSSHFRGGYFFLVVMTDDPIGIKPFIVDNFVVKARKTNEDFSARKKAKQDEGTSS